jgi:hypothetical protein
MWLVQRLLAAGSGAGRRQAGTPGLNPMHHMAGREISGAISRHMLHDANKSWIKAQDKDGWFHCMVHAMREQMLLYPYS